MRALPGKGVPEMIRYVLSGMRNLYLLTHTT